jgi:hypothetical protein
MVDYSKWDKLAKEMDDDEKPAAPTANSGGGRGFPALPGTRVRVRGIVKAPQYNGCDGVIKFEIAGGDRVSVQLDGKEGKQLSVRLENLNLLYGEDGKASPNSLRMVASPAMASALRQQEQAGTSDTIAALQAEEPQTRVFNGKTVNVTGHVVMSTEELALDAPLCAEDLEDFKRRLGNSCPTQQDAIRYARLEQALKDALVPKDFAVYCAAVLDMKDPTSTLPAKQVIAMFEQKILAGSERDKAKAKEWRAKYGESLRGLRPLIDGAPVRLKRDATRHGVVDGWSRNRGGDEDMVSVRFSGDAGAISVERDLLAALCSKSGCARDAPTLRCGGYPKPQALDPRPQALQGCNPNPEP